MCAHSFQGCGRSTRTSADIVLHGYTQVFDVKERRDDLLDVTISQSSRPARTRRKRFFSSLKREKKRELVSVLRPVSVSFAVQPCLAWPFLNIATAG